MGLFALGNVISAMGEESPKKNEKACALLPTFAYTVTQDIFFIVGN